MHLHNPMKPATVHPHARLARRLAALIAAAALAACGGERPAPQAQAAARPVAQGLKAQLDALEQSGDLPALDRSTDIAGPDADRNGIRDDIDAYIARLPVKESIRKAARQRARVQQRAMLIDLTDRPALLALSDASMAATACMSQSAEAGLPPEHRNKASDDGFAVTLKIEAITANTPERADRYIAYMRALHGTTTTYPTGQVCEDE